MCILNHFDTFRDRSSSWQHPYGRNGCVIAMDHDHIPQDARDPRVHEEKLERIEALWKHGKDFTRFGHSACQDMVHSCARLKQGETTQKSRCILHFGKSYVRTRSCISIPSELWQLVRFSRIWLKELRCLFYRSTDQVLAEHKKSKT